MVALVKDQEAKSRQRLDFFWLQMVLQDLGRHHHDVVAGQEVVQVHAVVALPRNANRLKKVTMVTPALNLGGRLQHHITNENIFSISLRVWENIFHPIRTLDKNIHELHFLV